jgi:hypothetical protein
MSIRLVCALCAILCAICVEVPAEEIGTEAFPAPASESTALPPSFVKERVQGRAAFRRVLFCGNSLTRHGPHAPIGWTNDWGMAASAPERDYVHLLVRALEARSGERPEFTLMGLPLEKGFENAEKVAEAAARAVAWKPDLAVIALGENAHSVTNDANEALCRAAYLATTRALREAGAEVVLRAPFWPNDRLRRILSGVAEETGAIYVDVGDLGTRDEMTAKGRFAHAGVAMHPGDAGMAAIADRILAAIVEHMEANGHCGADVVSSEP